MIFEILGSGKFQISPSCKVNHQQYLYWRLDIAHDKSHFVRDNPPIKNTGIHEISHLTISVSLKMDFAYILEKKISTTLSIVTETFEFNLFEKFGGMDKDL